MDLHKVQYIKVLLACMSMSFYKIHITLTGSDVEPVLVAGSQLFMLGQLNNVNPVWHLQLPRPVKTTGFKMSFSTHSQNYFIMVSQAYKNNNNH